MESWEPPRSLQGVPREFMWTSPSIALVLPDSKDSARTLMNYINLIWPKKTFVFFGRFKLSTLCSHSKYALNH
jgi:hypothetical protein